MDLKVLRMVTFFYFVKMLMMKAAFGVVCQQLASKFFDELIQKTISDIIDVQFLQDKDIKNAEKETIEDQKVKILQRLNFSITNTY